MKIWILYPIWNGLKRKYILSFILQNMFYFCESCWGKGAVQQGIEAVPPFLAVWIHQAIPPHFQANFVLLLEQGRERRGNESLRSSRIWSLCPIHGVVPFLHAHQVTIVASLGHSFSWTICFCSEQWKNCPNFPFVVIACNAFSAIWRIFHLSLSCAVFGSLWAWSCSLTSVRCWLKTSSIMRKLCVRLGLRPFPRGSNGIEAKQRKSWSNWRRSIRRSSM